MEEKKALRKKAWREASWEYGELTASDMLPFFSEPMSAEDRIVNLHQIIKTCGFFYPALLELSAIYASRGTDDKAERFLTRGFKLMMKIAKPEQREELAETVVENFTVSHRYDFARKALKLAMEYYPDSHIWYGLTAFTLAQQGDLSGALASSTRAVEIAPQESRAFSNHGTILLYAGKIEEAGQALLQSKKLDPKNSYTKKHLLVQAYLAKHGGNYLDYFVRPVDQKKINRLEAAEKTEELDQLCLEYNSDRFFAYAVWLVRQPPPAPYTVHDLNRTLQIFMDFVGKNTSASYYLCEQLGFLSDNFTRIMSFFIVQFKDIDQSVMDELVCTLGKFYAFLKEHQLVSAEDLEEFNATVEKELPELVRKMEEYGKVRNSGNQKKKEALRNKLFGARGRMQGF